MNRLCTKFAIDGWRKGLLALSLLFLLAFRFQAGAETRYFYYGPSGREFFTLSTDKVFITFEGNPGFKTQAKLLASEPGLQVLTEDQLIPSPKGVLARVKKGLTDKDILEMLQRLNANAAIRYASPFLLYHDGTQQAALDRFAVKLKQASDFALLETMARKVGVSIDSRNTYDPLVYFLKVSKSSAGNALELANQFAESFQFQYAEPDMIRLMKRFNTNDPFLNFQWSLNNTGSSIQFSGTVGADMKVFSAWGLSTGSSSIKVAVIDEGVDLVHPDLVANLLPGFDGTGLGSNGAPSGNDAHGTACAGIIAGVGNNNLGVAGVAYGCKIIPVRIAYSSGSSWITTNSQIGTSIDWSWNNAAADVLSNSWGGGGSSALINDPITRATTQGRGGLGSPVLFAAGNDNGANSYPATLSNVISVIAMSMCNQRKNPSSCDGETWWGSNFGTGADIAAPGVKIYTTDISGSAGYATGDYTPTFNGTSSATPNAAGVMALILSVNPSLTNTQARQIIESTCDKVGGYTYNSSVAGQPNGTWSTDLGYGRVNALSALQLANPVPCTSPPAVGTASVSPSSFCVPTSVSLGLSGVTFGTGMTFQWQSSPNNSTWTNISGATGQSASVSVSASTWYRCLVTCSGNTTPSTSVQAIFSNPTISTFPSTQNFDASSSLPCGWSNSDVNADGKTWAIGTTNSRSASNNVTYSYNASAAANDWLFSPPLQLVAGTTYRVRFWQRVRSATYPENLEVKWGAAASAAGMTSAAIYTGTSLTNTTYAERTGLITPTTSGVYHVGWRAFSNANMYDINIDDVTFETVTSCTTPLVGGTASGPASLTAGVAGSFSVSGATGSIQWQYSTNSGTSWIDVATGTTATASFSLPAGNIQVRARVFNSSCPDAFSNVLTVAVSAPAGENLANPIQASLPFSGTVNNALFVNDYTGTNNQTSPDVFYRFTTGPCTDSIRISSCGSGFDTYVHLLNASGTQLNSNDDNGPLCTGTAGSLKVLVSPNTTYFAVFEGYGSSTGTISVAISEIDNPTFTTSITTSGPTTFCAGGSVVLTAGAGSSYLWSSGATTQSITASTSGTYSVTVSNAAGCQASASRQVIVNPLPQVFNVSGSGSYCSVPGTGSTVSLSGSEAGVSYDFRFTATGSISVLTGTGSAISLPNVTGSGTVFVVATSANGCTTNMNGSASIFEEPAQTWFRDFDGDGFGALSNTLQACSQPVGFVSNSTDCDDNNAAINQPQAYYVDADLDGVGSDVLAMLCETTAPSGYSLLSGDCNDNDNQVTVSISYFVDADKDGFGTDEIVKFCSATPPIGFATVSGDCDDENANRNPGMTEVCGNDLDDNCDGNVDEGCQTYTWYQDADGDGYGDSGFTTITSSPVAPSGYVAQAGDCNDANEAINPAASEICNGIDDNCDGTVDNGIPTLIAPTSIGGPAGVCRNTTGIIFSVDPVAGATVYNWTLPAGATGSSSSNGILVSFGSAYVTGNICVSVSNGCTTTASLCRSVVRYTAVPSTPVAISGSVTDNCVGTIRTYSVAPVANTTSYTWTVPANTQIISGAGTNTIQLQINAGFLSGSLSVWAVNCVGQSSARSLTIYLRPATPSSISGTVNGVCAGTTQTYSCPVTAGATSYTWTVPSGATLNSGQGTNSISVTFPTPFVSGTVSVVAANACSTSTARTVTVRSVPAQPGNISGTSTNLCGGGTFTYSITAVAGATGYNWTLPANCTLVTNSGNSISMSVPSNFTTGTLSVIAFNGCGNSTARTLSLTRLPATPGTISGPASVCPSATGLTYTVPSVAGLTYTWTLPSGASVVSGQGTNSISANWGTVAGSVVVRANNTCGSSSNRTLAVTLLACRPMVDAGDEATLTDVSISPNPGAGLFNLDWSGFDGQAEVKVYNAQGQLVLEKAGSASELSKLHLENMPAGLYQVMVKSEAFSKVLKVVKQ
jgi:subtilisin family serine protease